MKQITLRGMDPEIEREIRRMAKKKANPLTVMQESLISLSGKELQSRPMTYGLLHKPWNTEQNLLHPIITSKELVDLFT